MRVKPLESAVCEWRANAYSWARPLFGRSSGTTQHIDAHMIYAPENRVTNSGRPRIQIG